MRDIGCCQQESLNMWRLQHNQPDVGRRFLILSACSALKGAAAFSLCAFDVLSQRRRYLDSRSSTVSSSFAAAALSPFSSSKSRVEAPVVSRRSEE